MSWGNIGSKMALIDARSQGTSSMYLSRSANKLIFSCILWKNTQNYIILLLKMMNDSWYVLLKLPLVQ